MTEVDEGSETAAAIRELAKQVDALGNAVDGAGQRIAIAINTMASKQAPGAGPNSGPGGFT